MKHLLNAVLVILLTAGLASAAAIADNDQFQGQFDGGIGVAGGGFAAGIGGAAAGQLGYGFSASSPGDSAFELQSQDQTNVGAYGADDGAGNFHVGATITDQSQESGSATGLIFGGPGVAANAQAQGIVLGSAGIGIGGQFGAAGSAGLAAGASGSFALGDAVAANEQSQVGAGAYQQQTVGANGYIFQEGSQVLGTQTGSGAALAGAGLGVAAVGQVGGTVAANNGQATYMEGHGTAVGNAVAAGGGLGVADGQAYAFGTQEHSYTQEVATPSAYQMQTGTVSTTVQAGAPF